MCMYIYIYIYMGFGLDKLPQGALQQDVVAVGEDHEVILLIIEHYIIHYNDSVVSSFLK